MSGRIWLWVYELETLTASTQQAVPTNVERDQPSAADLRKKREQKYSTLGDLPPNERSERPSQQFGPVDSGGGAVYQGNENIHATYQYSSR